HVVGEGLGVALRYEWPDAGDDRNPDVVDGAEELLQLIDVEHRLGDGVLGASLNLPLEALQLLRRIDRRRIHADTDGKTCRLTDRVPAGIEPVIQVADE